jgi:hypothetical protein
MILLHAKSYYPAGAYTMLFAGGAVALEGIVTLTSVGPREATSCYVVSIM